MTGPTADNLSVAYSQTTASESAALQKHHCLCDKPTSGNPYSALRFSKFATRAEEGLTRERLVPPAAKVSIAAGKDAHSHQQGWPNLTMRKHL